MIKGQQKEALQFLDGWVEGPEQLAVLKGYAGTGKTWLMGHWLERVSDRHPNWKIYVMAPTNKALDVLRGKCKDLENVAFMTVDSFLGNKIKRNDDGETVKSRTKGQEDPDLLICDEASMIKAEYDADLRRRKVKMLYVGDPAQLPPINETLSTAFAIPNQFLMTEVVRYEGAIIKVATMLRERIDSGEMFLLSDLRELRGEDRSLSFIKMYDLHDWALKAVRKGMDARIVAFTNADVNNHNAVMHRALFPGMPLFGVGERVVVNETFEVDLGIKDTKGQAMTEMLCNGEMFTVTECELADPVEGVVICNVGVTNQLPVIREDGSLDVSELTRMHTLQVCFDETAMQAKHRELTDLIWEGRREGKNDEVKRLVRLRAPLNKLAPLRHSYSCTVHKSQGSTYDIAFCDWSSIYKSKDRAKMMYVAATRPSKFLVMAAT